ncbi:MAG: UDP-3-O-(3-hydroxymyristoyl)glucosamine N-acyltransferase, partial [Deltaproteobacteria bacterium]|nr:UDP-3-O-(3-hydroxymyristoyl)glucosamine N-acyltransferase [Deltaproteobacteria bacterium]
YVGRACIGARCRIFPFVYVDDDVLVGDDCEIRPGCTLMNGTRLGDRVLLQPGVQLGGDGFGFASDGARHVKIPQIGGVEIGSDVELGALAAVDRAAFDATRIGRGTKIDNQVQIGHNVQVGEDVILCGQVGIAGSTAIGDRAVIAGKVGIADHIRIGSECRVGAGSGVIYEVPDRAAYSGYPAIPHGLWLRTQVEVKRLDHHSRRMRALERRLRELEVRCGLESDDGPAAAPPAEENKP